MKQEIYNELEKIVVGNQKEGYFIFELLCCMMGVLLVLGLFSVWGDVPMMIAMSLAIIIFVIRYLSIDSSMIRKTERRKQIMEELKKEVK